MVNYCDSENSVKLSSNDKLGCAAASFSSSLSSFVSFCCKGTVSVL